MAVLSVKTVDAEQIWKSPDGQRILNNVTLEYQGKTFKVKTYSNKIAEIGWSGDIETYEKEGKNGLETFARQPAKEGGYSGGRSSGKDDEAIQAMWAITKAIEWASNDKDVKYTDLADLAVNFFNMVDEVKTGSKEEDILPDTQSLDELLNE